MPKHAAGRVPIILQFGGSAAGSAARAARTRGRSRRSNKGWGHGTINPSSIQGDNNRLREGIIGLTNKGEPRSPEDWGALRAWAWGVSRLIDYFEANPDSGVDPTKVCITGVSRYGKAALVATAFDTAHRGRVRRLLRGRRRQAASAATSASCWKTWPAAAGTTGWPATS